MSEQLRYESLGGTKPDDSYCFQRLDGLMRSLDQVCGPRKQSQCLLERGLHSTTPAPQRARILCLQCFVVCLHALSQGSAVSPPVSCLSYFTELDAWWVMLPF